MKAKRLIKTHMPLVKKYPLFPILAGGVVLLAVILYAVFIFAPKSVPFSYASATCVNQFTPLPNHQKQQGGDGFKAKIEGVVSIGSLQLYGTKVCVSPVASPETGDKTFTLALANSPIVAKQFAISVPEAPKVSVAPLNGRKIAAGKPLAVAIASPDTVHEYTISAGEATAACAPTKQSLECDVPSLKLEHGKPYTLVVHRSYPNTSGSVSLGSINVTTLEPVLITASSIANEQVIYDIPTSFSFEANRDLHSVDASLTLNKEGASPVAEKLKATIEGNKFILALPKPLERKAQYTLQLTQVEAKDESTLPDSIAYAFSASGGPKVASVSVGATKVGQSERILVTFDQPLDDSVNVSQFVKANGVPAAVAKVSATQVAVTLQSAPLCAGFSITVDKGMKSASNGAVADEAWKLDSRIVCGVSSVIGYSVKGRPIVAHYFGSGGTTILFTGGIHGSEPSSTTTMQAWVEHLQTTAHKIPADKRVVVVPNTNPDGIASGSRNNANNVNLGRNFPTANWKADIETASGLLKNGGGTSAGSEPEAAALSSLTRQLRPRLEVSFHAQGSLVGANKFGDSVSVGDTYAKLVGYRTMFYNAEAVMGYPMTGEYEDWMGESLGIPAILIELPRLSGNYFTSHQNALWRMVNL